MNVPSLKPLAIVAGIALALGACSQKPAETESATTPAAESAAATTAERANVAFDTSELDPSINVCADLNGFVNNKWLAANPIPADKTRWGTFDVLREASLKTQHEIAEAAANSNAAAGSIEQKVGALYKAGMDEAAIDALGAEPLKPELAKIDALEDKIKANVAELRKLLEQG